jgi:hypothetical protein
MREREREQHKLDMLTSTEKVHADTIEEHTKNYNIDDTAPIDE